MCGVLYGNKIFNNILNKIIQVKWQLKCCDEIFKHSCKITSLTKKTII